VAASTYRVSIATVIVAAALAGCASQPAVPSAGGALDAAPSSSWSLFGERQATLPPPRPTIQNLLKLEARQVQTLLGQPDLSRRETPAQVWQYRNDTCVLIVFLYPRAPQLRDAPNGVTPGGAPDVTARAASPPGADDTPSTQPLEVRHAEVFNRGKRRQQSGTTKADAQSRATTAGEIECIESLLKSATAPRPAPPAPAS
jgi:hypothetical protein